MSPQSAVVRAGAIHTTPRRRTLAVVAFGALLSAAALGAPRASGPPQLFLNVSASMPLGIYRLVRGTPHVGSLVIFPSSVIPDCGLELPKYLLKRVAASGGTAVRIDSSGLSIAGVSVASRVKDIGVPFAGTLTANEVAVLGENPRSFDSRYFGPVDRTALSLVKAVETW